MAIEIKIPERKFGVASQPLLTKQGGVLEETKPKSKLPFLQRTANVFLPKKFEFKEQPSLSFEIGDMPMSLYNRYYKNELNLDFTPFDPETTEQEKMKMALQPYLKKKIIPKAPKRTEAVGQQPGLLFLEGVKEELSFGYLPTQLEAETMPEKIAQTAGQFVGITIPFIATAGAISAAKVIPSVGKFALRYPRMANVFSFIVNRKKRSWRGKSRKSSNEWNIWFGIWCIPVYGNVNFSKVCSETPNPF